MSVTLSLIAYSGIPLIGKFFIPVLNLWREIQDQLSSANELDVKQSLERSNQFVHSINL